MHGIAYASTARCVGALPQFFQPLRIGFPQPAEDFVFRQILIHTILRNSH